MLQAVSRPIPFGDYGGRSVSLSQASAALRVCRRTVYYLIKAGHLQTVRTPLGSQRVLVDSVRACWESRL